MTQPLFVESIGRRPCPRCGRQMAEFLTICIDCQFQEAERARRQETFDQLMMDAELEAREAEAARKQEPFDARYQDAFFDAMATREADRRDLAETQDCVIASMRGW